MKNKKPSLVKYTRRFDKQRKALPLEVKIAFLAARELFLENPNHPSLRNHGLKERFVSFRSIDITDDYRAIYNIRNDGGQEIITFYLIGTHEELYGKVE